MINPLLNAEWLERLAGFNRLFVGFSGGLDSSLLLAILAAVPALKKKITAVHINHGLSPHAMAWQTHCEVISNRLEVDFYSRSLSFDSSSNIEESAREARYQVFASLIKTGDALVLGHHLDDQAETLLLHLFRGAGIDGLAAMPADKAFARGRLLRPLLEKSRIDLEESAKKLGLIWIEDESNQNRDFSRNYLRHELIPQLRSRWPGVVKTIARTASHCQDAVINLEQLALMDCPALNNPSMTLDLNAIENLPKPRLTNVLRFWLRSNQLKLPSTQTFKRIISELVEASEDACPQIEWGSLILRRYQQRLYLERSNQSWVYYSSYAWTDFPSPLVLCDGDVSIHASYPAKGAAIPANAKIDLRFRQGGETMVLRGQHKQLKKLFQDWKIPPWQRSKIPLLYVNDQLAVIIGYAVSDDFYSESGWDLTLRMIDGQTTQ